jgi:two-component system alkaline phosphatase synthesis response regulator PhoP
MNDQACILLVDDEPDVLSLYQMALTQAGFQVITASNGADAIVLAKQKHPSLILMDVKMPGMDGVETAVKIKEDPDTANLKLVFLTAFSDPAKSEIDVKAAKEMGALDFLKKGISVTELRDKVKQYLAA